MIKTASEKIYNEKLAALNEGITFNPLQERVINSDNPSMIIAHPVGSGKTLSGIGKFEKSREKGLANKALVVTPAALRENFATEGVKKFTNSKANVVGNKGEIKKGVAHNIDPNADYNILSYEMFRKDPERYLRESGADTVIADEFHRTRNNSTSTADSFLGSRDKYKNFIGLTGSVLNNQPSDIVSQVNIATNGNHSLGKNRTNFNETYLKRSDSRKYRGLRDERKPIVGINHSKFLKKELDNVIDYADIDDVRDIAKIPHKDLSYHKVPITKEQLKMYKGLIEENPEMVKLVYNKKLETFNDAEMAKAFNGLIESRKLMNSIGSIKPGISLTDSAKITPKTKRVLDDLEEHLSKTKDGQGILLTNIINGGTDVLEAGLKDRGIDYGLFIGKGNKGITEETRQQAVKDYKDRKKRVMIVSGAGAEGLSLNDTTWEATLDPHYNPERMNQMEARGIRSYGLMHRPEKDRRVSVNRYVSTIPKKLGIIKSPMKTPDEIIYNMAKNKEEQNKVLLDLLRRN